MLGNNLAQQVDDAVRVVAPIDGVSIGDASNKATWRIDFRPEASLAQRAAALDVVTNFVPSAPGPTIVSQIDALPGNIPQALKDVLKRIAGGR